MEAVLDVQNSFECLSPVQQAGGPDGGKRRRRRRGKGSVGAGAASLAADSVELVRQSSDGLLAEGAALDGESSDAGGRLSTDLLQVAVGSSMHLAASDDACCPPWQRYIVGDGRGPGPAAAQRGTAAELGAAAPPPFRSRSDLTGVLALHMDIELEHSMSDITARPLASPGAGLLLGSVAEAQAQASQPTSPRVPPPPERPPLRRRPSMSEVLFQPFSDYLSAELQPGPSYPTADVVWGQTERDRVYNAILAVPYQLERFLWFGMLVCLDSFLAIFTLLPVRFAYALYVIARDCLASRLPGRPHPRSGNGSNSNISGDGGSSGSSNHNHNHGFSPRQQRHQPCGSSSSRHVGAEGPPDAGVAPEQQEKVEVGKGEAGGEAGQQGPGGDSGSGRGRGQGRLRGDQLYDLLGVLIFGGTVLFLWNLNAGALYFWMKDLTQEFLKLSVLFTALELSDKICCNFGVDVLEALAASCTQFMAAPSLASREAANLASDVVVAAVLVILHGMALMSHAMVFGVAMNSKKNALVALLIAANFTEIKGTVLKRFDSSKLYVLACQDVVERFHLLITLAFVVVEEMGSSGHTVPNRAILVQCAQIFFSEAVIDVIKHAVLGKFNEIRPGVYREFMKDLCERVSGAQSHNIHKLVGFEPFAPTALAFRIAVTYLALRHEAWRGASLWQAAEAAAVAAVAWLALFTAKILLGYLLKQASASYVRHYERRRAGMLKGGGARRVTLATAFPGMAKKEE